MTREHQILTFYADAFGTLRVEVWRGKQQLGSFGLLGDNNVPYKPFERVELSTRRLEKVAEALKLFGEVERHEYRRPLNPHMPHSEEDEPKPDTSADDETDLAATPDEPAVPARDKAAASVRQRNRRAADPDNVPPDVAE